MLQAKRARYSLGEINANFHVMYVCRYSTQMSCIVIKPYKDLWSDRFCHMKFKNVIFTYNSGAWSPLECTGSIPPPCAASITMTDDHHAVLYGARLEGENIAYSLDLEQMV